MCIITHELVYIEVEQTNLAQIAVIIANSDLLESMGEKARSYVGSRLGGSQMAIDAILGVKKE